MGTADEQRAELERLRKAAADAQDRERARQAAEEINKRVAEIEKEWR